MKLAWHMHTPLWKLVEEMPVDELELWLMYTAEPRGEDRDDWRIASLAKTVHSVGESFSKVRRDIPVEKFKLAFKNADPFTTAADPGKLAAEAHRIGNAFGGIIPTGAIRRGVEKIRASQKFWKPDGKVE